MSKPPKAPRAAPSAILGGLLFAVVLIALGAGCLQWLAADQGWTDGPAVADRLLDSIDGSRVAGWGLVAGIPMVLVGLWLLFIALKPRRQTHEPLPADVDAWISRGALAALASSTAQEASGVTEASSTLNRRTTLTVRVATEPDVTQERVLEAARSQVAARVQELTTRTVRVRPAKARR